MIRSDDSPRWLAAAVAQRSEALVVALRRLGAAGLRRPSALPGWSRLTVACHLRYGAEALTRMTGEALAGRPTAFYPDGRSRQRPGTLRPRPREGPLDVVASLGARSGELHRAWGALSEEQWSTVVVEPRANQDLGRVTLASLALLRLTEVEVHGTDLDIGLPDWSDRFVRAALPFRLTRLAVRRSNHRPVDGTIRGSWLLSASDGPTFLVAVGEEGVTSGPADPGAGADATIAGTSRDLLALLLGRPPTGRLTIRGGRDVAAAFGRAFPGP
ncbi:MAG TPA: maleylpyruvate isomerase family mycothiol-dependent enzyme [Acidimicrobiales bacterium]